MNRYYYDFHIHSCLSPCADDDMTPGNIAGMATLKGLNILADLQILTLKHGSGAIILSKEKEYLKEENINVRI